MLALCGAWLLGTEAGARFALARLQSALPADRLQWQAVGGSLSQGLAFERLRYRQDGLSIEVERLELRAALGALLGARLRIQAIDAEGLRIVLPPEPAEPLPPSFELTLPDALPSLVLPLALAVDSAELRGLRIERSQAALAPAAPVPAGEGASAAGRAETPGATPADAVDGRLFAAERIALASLTLDAGRLGVGELTVDAPLASLSVQGEIDSARDWQSALSLRGEWRAGLEVAQAFEVRLDGGLDAAHLELRLPDAPGFALTAEVREALPRPRWRLDLQAPAAPPALVAVWPAGLSAVQLRGDGRVDHAELSGGFAVDGRAYALEAVTLRTDASTLHIDALRLRQGAGSATLRGWLRLPSDEAPARFDAKWDSERFELPLADEAPLRVDGALEARGAFDDAELTLALQLARGERAGALSGGLRVQGQQALLQALELRTDEGRLRADGELDWREGLRWRIKAELAELDASLLAPAWPSRVSARLRSEGRETAAVREGVLQLEDLDGTLRGQALRGRISARWSGAPASAQASLPVAAGEAELDLRWGESALSGSASLGDALTAELQLSPLQIDSLAAGLVGALRGDLRLSGTPTAPRLGLDLRADRLSMAGIELDAAHLQGELGLAPEAPLRLRLDSAATRVVGHALGALELALRGEVSAHTLSLRQPVDGGGLALELAGGWRADEQRWLGRLQQLDWHAPGRLGSGGDWALAEPVAIELGARRLRFDGFCLEGTQPADRGRAALSSGALPAAQPQTAGGIDPGRAVGADSLGRLCASLRGESSESLTARIELDALPLSLALDLLSDRDGPARPRWQGVLGGSVDLSSRAGDWQVEGRLASTQGGLSLGRRESRELLRWQDFALDIAGDARQLRLALGARLGEDGLLQGELQALDAGSENARVEGQFALQLDQLGLLEWLSDEAIIAPAGRLSAELAFDGAMAAPNLRGGARLTGFSAELPALGIRPSEGRVELRFEGANAADLEFTLRSEGELRGRGRFDWSEATDSPLRLSIEGSEVLVSDTPQLRLVASPALELEQRDGLLRLRGRVDVPRAEVRLDRFEGSQQVSADVVVLDPAQPERAVEAAQRLDADVRVALGEAVALQGFGLKGQVRGELRVRDRPGRATRASGSLNVSGRYKAYGQDLDITRGRLSFAQSPLDNPGLDIRAERRLDEVTVGIRVTGTAAVPVLGLWSQPSLDQADVLSYLMLGRPVRAVRSGEGQQLNAAAAALGAGGNYIAERLGARLGFDQASVEDSAALGGAALMLGKFLSPRLYVAYGVALFGEGQVFSIKYLLTEQWDLQIEASQRETRGSVNYRLER
jgi:translocation and assembly module TamB